MDKAILAEQIRRWQLDPVSFVVSCFGAVPTPQQKSVMQAFARPGSKVAVSSGHGVGKSSLMAWLAIWHTLLFSDSKAAATAPSASQLRDVLMAEVGKWVNKAHPWVKNQLVYSNMRLSVKNREQTQFLTARTARKEEPSALQGLHANSMAFFIDEAFGVADSIYEVARGALSTPNSRVIMCGNPTATSGYAYNAFHKNKKLWTRFVLSCLDSPLVSEEYISEMAKEYGIDSDIYKVRVLGKFPSSAICQFISTDLVDVSAGRKIGLSSYSFAPVLIGVDVAYFGDDRSVICLRQGLMSCILGSWYDIDTMTLAGLVSQYELQYKADAVFVDVTGVGAGVVDRLRQLGRNPLAVYFGGKSSKARYLNKRAECWGNMKDWLVSGGAIDKDDDLREDLIGLQYGFSANNKIQLERKKDMKKRGLSSPDKAESLAITFAESVYKLSKIEEVCYNNKNVNRVETEYKLFN